jgi:hypothetical protein
VCARLVPRGDEVFRLQVQLRHVEAHTTQNTLLHIYGLLVLGALKPGTKTTMCKLTGHDNSPCDDRQLNQLFRHDVQHSHLLSPVHLLQQLRHAPSSPVSAAGCKYTGTPDRGVQKAGGKQHRTGHCDDVQRPKIQSHNFTCRAGQAHSTCLPLSAVQMRQSVWMIQLAPNCAILCVHNI